MQTAVTATAAAPSAASAGAARAATTPDTGFAALFALGLGADSAAGLLPAPAGDDAAVEPALIAALPDAGMLATAPLAPELLARLEAMAGRGAALTDVAPADAATAEDATAAASGLVPVIAALPAIPLPGAASLTPARGDPAAVALPSGSAMPAPRLPLAAAPGDGTTPYPFPARDRAGAAKPSASAPPAAFSADPGGRAPAATAATAAVEAATASATAPEAPAPAALAAPQPAPRAAADSVLLRIAAPISHPSWVGELDDKLGWMVGNARHEAELVINPPQLGRIEVSLVVQGDQVSASFASPHQAVREALENAMLRLRESLAESGIRLGDAHVGHEPRRDAQGESQRQSMRATPDEPMPGAPQPRELAWRPASARGLVDLFA